MPAFFPMIWVTLLGLSLLFVGGFVLWAYGAPVSHHVVEPSGVEAEATRKFHNHLVQWFFLYGLAAIVLGAACLLTAAVEFI